MGGFGWKELIKTFLFPALTIILGTVGVVSEILNSWEWGFREFFFPLIILGGVLSVILTISLKSDTQRYFFKRIVVFVIIYVLNRVIGSLSFSGWTTVLLFTAEVIIQIVKVQDKDTTPSERVVLIISDPMLYQAVDMLVLEFHIAVT